jgi:AraC-like DNA-binding protein
LSKHDPSTRDVAQQVRQVVGGLVTYGAGAPNIHRVADSMGTSVRTLQRQLRAAGLTYAAVLRQERCAAARRMLVGAHCRIADVARMLGYSDPAHFTRAFQSWTGLGPRAFRSRVRQSDDASRRG